MRKETKDHYSFIPTDKDRTLNWIEEKYGKYRVASTENNVEKYYILNTNDGKISLSMKAVEDNTQVDEVEKVETAKF